MVVILDLISDIFSNPDKNGNQRIVKKGVKFKKSFDSNTMTIQHYIDTKGNISKKYTTVTEGELSYKAIHKFEQLEKLISPIKINGFKIK